MISAALVAPSVFLLALPGDAAARHLSALAVAGSLLVGLVVGATAPARLAGSSRNNAIPLVVAVAVVASLALVQVVPDQLAHLVVFGINPAVAGYLLRSTWSITRQSA